MRLHRLISIKTGISGRHYIVRKQEEDDESDPIINATYSRLNAQFQPYYNELWKTAAFKQTVAKAKTPTESRERKEIEHLRKLLRIYESFAKKYFIHYARQIQNHPKLQEYLSRNCKPVKAKDKTKNKDNNIVPTFKWLEWNAQFTDAMRENLRNVLRSSHGFDACQNKLKELVTSLDMIPECTDKPKFAPLILDFMADFYIIPIEQIGTCNANLNFCFEAKKDLI
jgi:hypothetical protein